MNIVNYADNVVTLTRGRTEGVMVAMRDMMAKLKLTVSEKKTRKVCWSESWMRQFRPSASMRR